MNTFKGTVIAGILCLLSFMAQAGQQDKLALDGTHAPPLMLNSQQSLHPFPKAEEGFKRTVIRLPKIDKEENCKIEIIVGKTMKVDCNRHWFMGSLEAKDVEGTGYTYWILSKASGPASTRMGCPDNSLHDEFVRVQGEGYLLRYNSELPIVIHVPKDFEVRYRLWQTQDETSDAKEE